MRGLGAILVLVAVVAVQVPFFTCHADCQDECVPMWVFAAKHDHGSDGRCEDTHCDAHHHGCWVCDHHHDDTPEPEEERDHDPGDHELVFAPITLPTDLAPAPSPDLELVAVLAVELASATTRVEEPLRVARDAGPPGPPVLETVRLLL